MWIWDPVQVVDCRSILSTVSAVLCGVAVASVWLLQCSASIHTSASPSKTMKSVSGLQQRQAGTRQAQMWEMRYYCRDILGTPFTYILALLGSWQLLAY